MSVKLGDLATFINDKVDVGVTSIIPGTGITVDQPTGDVTISATGGGGGGIGGGGTAARIPKFDPDGVTLADSLLEDDGATVSCDGDFYVNLSSEFNGKVSLNESLEVGSPVESPSQEHVSVFNAFQVTKPTPGSTDISRTGIVSIGSGNSGNFTQFDHVLNLYSPSNLSDPTNFSDAKAFQYSWNDAYIFARIEATDYAGGNISPQWEVGDLSFEVSGARWQVSNGDYARFITPGSDPYFEVTPSDATFNVDTLFAGGITVSMDGNRIEDVGTPTLGSDAATKDYVDSTAAGGVAWPNEYDLTLERLLQGENPGTLDPATNAVTTYGVGAGASLTTGNLNTLIGADAGKSLTSGNAHVAVGYRALETENFTGGGCVAVGANALRNQNGIGITIFNTAVGHSAGSTITDGNTNILMGYSAGNGGGTALTTGDGNIIIGYFASPSSSSVNDEITLGNSSAAVLRCQQTSITALSDERDKTDIEDLPYGLDFVDSLKPKKFIWDHRPETDVDGNEVFSNNKGKKDVGFIAQELQTVDNEWLKLVYDSNPDKLEATYGKLIPVLVKAVQELSAKVKNLENK